MEEKEIIVRKAKIKNDMFLAYEYSERTITAKNNISTHSDAPIHSDLRNCFKTLIPHFALLTEEVSKEIGERIFEYNEPIPEEMIHKFSVIGFSIGGTGDGEGVTLIGNKELNTGKRVSFNTPFQRFYDDSENAYPYTRELNEAITATINEVELYMNGKQADPPMRSLFDDYGDEEVAENIDDIDSGFE